MGLRRLPSSEGVLWEVSQNDEPQIKDFMGLGFRGLFRHDRVFISWRSSERRRTGISLGFGASNLENKLRGQGLGPRASKITAWV